MSETDFKVQVLNDLSGFPKIWVLKTQERARRGVPDLILSLNGRFVAIELKIDGEEPTRLQRAVLENIQASNSVAFYTTPGLWPNHFKMLVELCDA